MVNLFFSGSAEGTARFHNMELGIEGETLVSLTLELNTGDISNPFNVSSRRDVYNSHYELDWAVSGEMRRLKKALKTDKQLCLWYSSKSIDEYLGMLASVAQFDGKGVNIYIADCTEICEGLAYLDNEDSITPVERQMLSPNDKKTFLEEWERIRSENAPLRMIKEGTVIGLPCDYIDNVIFSIIGDNEVLTAFIFEQFPWKDYPVKVTYINYRLRQLIAEGKINVVKEGWDTTGFYGAPMKNILRNKIKKHNVSK